MLLFLLLVLSNVGANADGNGVSICCSGLLFNDVYYDREVILGNLGRPNNLVMHKFSGTLFFSHTIKNQTDFDFEIVSYNLINKKYTVINDIPGGYAIAYDVGNDDIYFGGHDGIYKYNFITKTADFFAEDGKSIWGLFVSNNFYYIAYPTQKLYVYQDDVFVQVAEAIDIEIDIFFISKRFDIYFSNKTALYKVEKGSKIAIALSDEIAVRQIVEDAYGDGYFCGTDGIYIEDKPLLRIKKVAHINDAYGITFDENDLVIYSDNNSIYRLKPSKHSDFCYKMSKVTEIKDN